MAHDEAEHQAPGRVKPPSREGVEASVRPGSRRLRLERRAETVERLDVAVVHRGVIVIELLILVADAEAREPVPKNARTVVEVVLVAAPALDVEESQALQALRVALGHEDGIPLQPSRPDGLVQLPGLRIERQVLVLGHGRQLARAPAAGAPDRRVRGDMGRPMSTLNVVGSRP
jgi:hypothetical protein